MTPNLLSLFRHHDGTVYPAGTTVIEEGSPGIHMYVLLEGQAEIRSRGVALEVAGPGSIFGEMSLIDDDPRSAQVVTKTECRLVEIDRKRFEFMVTQTPYFALAVMRVMADRLRRANARMAGA